MIKPPFDIILRDGFKTRYTGVYTKSYSSCGNLYCFNARVTKGGKDIVLRITSKRSDFKTLYSIDIIDEKMEPIKGMEIINDKGKTSSEIVEKTIKCLFDPKNKEQIIKEGIFDNLEKLGPFLLALFTFFGLYGFISVKLKNWFNEKESNSNEDSMNKELFGNQTGKESEFDCYNRLVKCIEMVIHNPKIKSLIICGIPGTSKTYMVRRTLYFNKLKCPSDYNIVKGTSDNIYDFCTILYKNNGKLLVLDDFDKPLESEGLINVLKAATDSYSKRIISIPRATKVDQNGGKDMDLPPKFTYSGKIIIITNKTFSSLDKALISRSLTVEVNFKPEEFVENIKKMLKYIMPDIDMSIKEEVLDYINGLVRKHSITGLNFRTFESAITIRLLYDNWKEMILYVLK